MKRHIGEYTTTYARGCWEQANLLQAVDSRAGIEESFLEWFFNTAQELSELESSKFTVVLWAIWKQRNSKIWDNRINNPCRSVAAATSFLFDWLSNSNKHGDGQASANQSNTHTWSPPPSGAMKCNVDAAFFMDIKTAGIGMVIRNVEGGFVMARTLLVKGLRCVKEGEAIGVLEALSWIRNLEFPTVLFEVDAQQVSQAMNETTQDLTEFGAIIGQRREILALHPGFLVKYIRRESNEVAHVLAKHSKFYDILFTLLEPPTCIRDFMSVNSAISNVE